MLIRNTQLNICTLLKIQMEDILFNYHNHYFGNSSFNDVIEQFRKKKKKRMNTRTWTAGCPVKESLTGDILKSREAKCRPRGLVWDEHLGLFFSDYYEGLL